MTKHFSLQKKTVVTPQLWTSFPVSFLQNQDCEYFTFLLEKHHCSYTWYTLYTLYTIYIIYIYILYTTYSSLHCRKNSSPSDPNSADHSGTHLYSKHLIPGTCIKTLLNSKWLKTSYISRVNVSALLNWNMNTWKKQQGLDYWSGICEVRR